MQQFYHTAVPWMSLSWLFQNNLVTITPDHSKSLVMFVSHLPRE